MKFSQWLENKLITEGKKKKKKWIQKTHMEKGAFTDYCGGEVTADCIEKGLKSDDPHVVKMASLAKTLKKIGKKKKSK